MINNPLIEISKNVDPNVILFKITISKEDFESFFDQAYQEKKNKYKVFGYRQGESPRAKVERKYGEDIFLDGATKLAKRAAADALKADPNYNIMVLGDVEVLQAEKGKPFISSIFTILEPEIKLGQYKGLKYKKMDTSISDTELAEAIENDLQSYSTTRRAHRPIQNGDEILLDFKGYIDGVPFEGGSASRFSLVIGSQVFIPGFEEKLIGVNEYEPTTISVVFPNDYYNEDLRGKQADFECYVTYIKETVIPDPDDEFAKQMGFDSFDSYVAALKIDLENQKKEKVHDIIIDNLVDRVVASSSILVPTPILNMRTDVEKNVFLTKLQDAGTNLGEYLKHWGQTEEEWMEQIKAVTLHNVQTEFILKDIVKKENLTVNESELEAMIQESSKESGLSVEVIKNVYLKDMEEQYLIISAGNLIFDNAIEE